MCRLAALMLSMAFMSLACSNKRSTNIDEQIANILDSFYKTERQESYWEISQTNWKSGFARIERLARTEGGDLVCDILLEKSRLPNSPELLYWGTELVLEIDAAGWLANNESRNEIINAVIDNIIRADPEPRRLLARAALTNVRLSIDQADKLKKY